eukprot:gnl/MRDRNA2_/MRDRNA2_33034_c0_seq1.p1 gnl/MRDRNA2_/MRDRNA2_33034_c0~~gnl/MRDRNA2_/MRDRNA2_33034_c0_seq1.p1  ORF type:complete len:851 (-),score=88.87 gnl/MRDRNA2_/MRDRNA2_33034_c0_seq1:58-2550(-)
MFAESGNINVLRPEGYSSPQWQRPWENTRDPATYATSFATSYATNTFLDVSRTFLQAIHNGEADNQENYVADGCIRLDDIYHLHKLVHQLHATHIRFLCSLGPFWQRILFLGILIAALGSMSLLGVVHFCMISPFTRMSSMNNLSAAAFEAAQWHETEDGTPTVLRLNLRDDSRPRQWLSQYVEQLWTLAAHERALLQERTAHLGSNGTVGNSTAAQGLREALVPWLSDTVIWLFEFLFPERAYEIVVGDPAWLELRGHVRSALVRQRVLEISAQNQSLFGPWWFAELLDWMRLYDVYVLNSLPIQFVDIHRNDTKVSHLLEKGVHAIVLLPPKTWQKKSGFSVGRKNETEMATCRAEQNTHFEDSEGTTCSSAPMAHAPPASWMTFFWTNFSGNSSVKRRDAQSSLQKTRHLGGAFARKISNGVVLGPKPLMPAVHMEESAAHPGPLSLWWFCRRLLWAGFVIPLSLAFAIFTSAVLRIVLITLFRWRLYSSAAVRQMRRYAFIAESLRRLNCYSSSDLLEVWVAFAALLLIVTWLASEMHILGWRCGLFMCYLAADYWGLMHVRTMQTRYAFPRAMVLLHCGSVVYLSWWPLAPEWLVVTATALTQLHVTLALSHRFDCFANLPEQPPLRLFCRSLLLPASPMARDPVPQRPTRGLKVPHPLREEFSSLVPPRRVASQPGRQPRSFSPRPMRPPAAPVRSQNHAPVQTHPDPSTPRHAAEPPESGAEGSRTTQARVSDAGCSTFGAGTSSLELQRTSGESTSSTLGFSETSGASTSPVQSQSTGCQAGPETPARTVPVFRTTACQTTGGLLDGLGPFDHIPDHVPDGS